MSLLLARWTLCVKAEVEEGDGVGLGGVTRDAMRDGERDGERDGVRCRGLFGVGGVMVNGMVW